jgi:hypothetical protein
MKKLVHKCNDAGKQIEIYFKDGKIDEIWVWINGLSGWHVIPYSDLKEALDVAQMCLKNCDDVKKN